MTAQIRWWCMMGCSAIGAGLASAAHAQWMVTNLHPASATESVAMGVGAAGGTVRVAGYARVNAAYHAGVWGTTAASWVDLHPAASGAPNSIAYATDGLQQVGVVFTSSTLGAASLWTSTAASWTNLTPVLPLGTTGAALGVAGGQQVGVSKPPTGTSTAAVTWSGTSVQTTRSGSSILATNGSAHVGYSGGTGFPIPSPTNAALWIGTNASGVTLHSAAMYSSSATGVSGAQQVGWFQTSMLSSTRHACMWTGSAASVIDLHPVGAVTSEATGVNAGVQVGTVSIVDPNNQFGTVSRAGLWTGTPASFVNLHAFVPATFADSAAKGVWSAAGSTFVVGSGFNNATGRTEALLWTLVSAPTCDSIDFNGDTLFPDVQDITDFLTVFSGGPCPTGTCGDIDFNNDGLFPDTLDIQSLLSVFGGGPCLS